MIKVVIIEDLPIVLEGLKVLINSVSDFKIVGEYSNGQEFMNDIANVDTDIILTDIDMPVMDGITTTQKAISYNAGFRIIALSMHNDRKYYYDMITAGAKGFVLKQSHMKELETAIRLVHNGELFFSPDLLRGIILDIQNLESEEKNAKEKYDLNDREIEALTLICQGYTNKELADKMFVSIRTIESYKSKLMQKANTKNNAGLIIWAVKNQIVSI